MDIKIMLDGILSFDVSSGILKKQKERYGT